MGILEAKLRKCFKERAPGSSAAMRDQIRLGSVWLWFVISTLWNVRRDFQGQGITWQGDELEEEGKSMMQKVTRGGIAGAETRREGGVQSPSRRLHLCTMRHGRMTELRQLHRGVLTRWRCQETGPFWSLPFHTVISCE